MDMTDADRVLGARTGELENVDQAVMAEVVGVAPRYTNPLILKPVRTFADIYLSKPRPRGLGDG